MAPGGLAAVSARAWAELRAPSGRLRVALSSMPLWAVVEVHRAGGGLYFAGPPGPKGVLSVQLPVGEYRVVLRAPGGRDEFFAKVIDNRDSFANLIAPTASKLAFTVTEASGASIAARLDLRGVPPTPDPDLGSPHYAGGAKTSVYTATGQGEIALPAGRYSVLVSHGPEYSIARSEVVVTKRDGAVLRESLERVIRLDSHLPSDFHLHALPSGDSLITLSDRIVSLLAEDVRFAVATDHNEVTDYSPTVAASPRPQAIMTEIGCEVTTNDWGHFNVFPYPLHEPLPDLFAPPKKLFSALRRAAPGVLIQVNHPRMQPRIGYFNLGRLDARRAVAANPEFSWDFDTIEVFNGFDLANPPEVERNLRDWLQLMNRGRRYVAVGSSDSHRLDTQFAGYPRTYVRVEADASRSLSARVVAAVKAGRAFVTNGPLLELKLGDAVVGDMVTTSAAEVNVSLRVLAAPWVAVDSVQLLVNGVPVESAPVPDGGGKTERLVLKRTLKVKKGRSSIIAIARGSEPLVVLNGLEALPFAFTNPVFVERK